MDNNLDTLCYIHEQTSYESDNKNFGYEVVDKGNRFYIKFPTVLQSFGVMNRNGRCYDADNIMNCINTDPYIQDMLKKNSWVGEADHPAAEKKGEELTMQRIANPDVTNSSHFIRSPHIEGNLLKANIQSDSSTDAGMNMAIKVVDGKIVPCFSARVFGALKNIGGKPTVFVRKLITYDWVLFPSHAEATAEFTQPLQESVDMTEHLSGKKIIFFPELAQMAANSSKDTELLCESFGLDINNVFGLTTDGSSLVINEKKNIYVQPLRDKVILERTQNTLKDFFMS